MLRATIVAMVLAAVVPTGRALACEPACGALEATYVGRDRVILDVRTLAPVVGGTWTAKLYRGTTLLGSFTTFPQQLWYDDKALATGLKASYRLELMRNGVAMHTVSVDATPGTLRGRLPAGFADTLAPGGHTIGAPGLTVEGELTIAAGAIVNQAGGVNVGVAGPGRTSVFGATLNGVRFGGALELRITDSVLNDVRIDVGTVAAFARNTGFCAQLPPGSGGHFTFRAAAAQDLPIEGNLLAACTVRIEPKDGDLDGLDVHDNDLLDLEIITDAAALTEHGLVAIRDNIFRRGLVVQGRPEGTALALDVARNTVAELVLRHVTPDEDPGAGARLRVRDNIQDTTLTVQLPPIGYLRAVFLDNVRGVRVDNHVASCEPSGWGVYIRANDDSPLDAGVIEILASRVSGCRFAVALVGADGDRLDQVRVQGNRVDGGAPALQLSGRVDAVIADNAFQAAPDAEELDAASLICSGAACGVQFAVSTAPGPNIAGGPTLGGNAWANYAGKDDNGDGFGDTSHVLGTAGAGGPALADPAPLVSGTARWHLRSDAGAEVVPDRPLTFTMTVAWPGRTEPFLAYRATISWPAALRVDPTSVASSGGDATYSPSDRSLTWVGTMHPAVGETLTFEAQVKSCADQYRLWSQRDEGWPERLEVWAEGEIGHATFADAQRPVLLRPDLRIAGLEVTQGTQDLAQSVPLVVHRETAIRAFVEVVPPSGVAICDVPGAVVDVLEPWQTEPRVPSMTAVAQVGVARPSDFDRRDRYVAWVVPAGRVTEAGAHAVRVALNPGCVVPEARCADDAWNAAEAQVLVVDEPELELELVRMAWRRFTWSDPTTAAIGDGFAVAEAVRELLPYPSVGVTHRRWAYGPIPLGEPGPIWFAMAAAAYEQLGRRPATIDAAALALLYVGDKAGKGELQPAIGGAPQGSPTMAFGTRDAQGVLGAFEQLGHYAGLGNVDGGVACQTPDPDASYPFENGRISPSEEASESDTVYGYGRAGVQGPEAWDALTACAPGLRHPSAWMLDALRDAHPREDPATVSSSQTKTLRVWGWVDLDSDAGALMPALVVDGVSPFAVADFGEHKVTLRNGAVSVGSFPLALQPAADRGAAGERWASFTLEAPWPSQVSRVELTRGGTLIDWRDVSANAPTVSITSLFGGEVLGGAPFTLAWAADDGDEDDLVFHVSYSADGGATWDLLAAQLSEPQVIIDPRDLPGSVSARFRVVASDGIWGAEAVSPGVVLERNAPVAAVLWPPAGVELPAGELIELRGAAWDPEDGELSGPSLEWQDIHGTLIGTGQVVYGVELAPGPQTIFLRVTDSDGDKGEAKHQFDIIAPKLKALASAGPQTPDGALRTPGQRDVPVLQLQLTATAGQDLLVRELRFTTSGDGDERAVERVILYEDRDGSGTVTDGDTPLADGHFVADDGELTLSLSDAFALPLGGPQTFLVAYDLAPRTTAQGPPPAPWAPLVIFALLPALGFLTRDRRRMGTLAASLLALSLLGSCGSSELGAGTEDALGWELPGPADIPTVDSPFADQGDTAGADDGGPGLPELPTQPDGADGSDAGPMIEVGGAYRLVLTGALIVDGTSAAAAEIQGVPLASATLEVTP